MTIKKLALSAATIGLAAAGFFAPIASTVNAKDLGQGPGDNTNNLSKNATEVGGEDFYSVGGTDNNATAKSTAEFSIEAGTLQLVAVPDLNFGKVSATIVMNGGEKNLENSTVGAGSSKGATAHDGNNQGFVQVRDNRGSNAGWELSLAMNPAFTTTDGETSKLDDISLSTVEITGVNQFEDELKTTSNQGFNGTAKAFAKAGKNFGSGLTTYKLGENQAKLIFPRATNRSLDLTKAYQSDLTWTLVAAPLVAAQ